MSQNNNNTAQISYALGILETLLLNLKGSEAKAVKKVIDTLKQMPDLCKSQKMPDAVYANLPDPNLLNEEPFGRLSEERSKYKKSKNSTV